MKHLIFITTLFVAACTPDDAPGTAGTSDSEFAATGAAAGSDSTGYDFDSPGLSLVLPAELVEISGLSVLPDGRLAAVQDEQGILYVLNRETGTVEARIPFAEPGDYEGVEWVGEQGYVLRADGAITVLSGSMDDLKAGKTHETSLKGKNDTEGLGYDSVRGRLLIACKEDPGSGLDKDERAIYAFDPATGELETEPAYVINTKDVEDLASDVGNFKPSAIAVHPSSGDVYVLSASDRAIIVLSGDGVLRSVRELSKDLFEQPEGIAFSSDGTLYISSEGSEGPAMLYEFRLGGSGNQ